MSLEAAAKPKFVRMARVLPNNDKSFNLIKEEEAKEAAEKEKEQAVSTFHTIPILISSK